MGGSADSGCPEAEHGTSRLGVPVLACFATHRTPDHPHDAARSAEDARYTKFRGIRERWFRQPASRVRR